MSERELQLRTIAQQIAHLRGIVGELGALHDGNTDVRILLKKLDEAYEEALLVAHIAYEDSKKGELHG